MPILALAHSARSATGSSTAWITAAVAAATFVLTAGLTLLVQLYIVPRVETRKRRDDRWERNVLELGELLTTQVRRLAQEAHSAQSMVRFLYRDLEGVVGVDQKQLEKTEENRGRRHDRQPKTFTTWLTHGWTGLRTGSAPSLVPDLPSSASLTAPPALTGWRR